MLSDLKSTAFIILTGGASSRFGSDKSTIDFDGSPLIKRIMDSLPDGEIIIVGPEPSSRFERSVIYTIEEPAGSGPVSAIAAGLHKTTSDQVIVIATDMPYAGEIANILLSHPLEEGALVPLDADGRRQPLCAKYKTSSLKIAFEALGLIENSSMNSLLNKLAVTELRISPVQEGKLIDIDTPADLEKALKVLRETP